MVNLLYYPRLSSGEKVALSWPIRLYRWTNHITWPLEDNVARWYYIFDRVLWIFGFLIFIMHNDAVNRYLRANFQNLDDMLTGIPSYIILIECHIRAFRLGLRKEKFKILLQQFYAEIYIEESTNPKQYKIIQRQLWPTVMLSSSYMISLTIIILFPFYTMSTGNWQLLYKMIPLMEYQNNVYLYLPLVMSNIWVGFTACTMIQGEPTILANLIFHLNGRYVLMRQNFHNKTEQILKSDSNTHIAARYRHLLIETLQENVRLNKFAEYIKNEYSFQVFMILSFSAMILCTLGFKVYTNPIDSLNYIGWTFSKIQETLSYGDMGSAITTTTDEISSMYYESGWEAIIARSTDTKENIRLMKLVTLSMLTNRKPFYLTGLNFFNVSLTSVLTILQGAFSYFTCLIALR